MENYPKEIMSGLAGLPLKSNSVRSSLSEQNDLVSQLHSEISALEEALYAIMGPNNPEKEATKTPPNLSEMLDQVNGNNRGIHGATVRIETMRSRLTI